MTYLNDNPRLLNVAISMSWVLYITMREKTDDPDLHDLYASIIPWASCSIASPMTRGRYLWICAMASVCQTEFCVRSAMNVQMLLIVAQPSITSL
jgi:hypothetical protein